MERWRKWLLKVQNALLLFLVVEDEFLIQDLVTGALKDGGYVTEVVALPLKERDRFEARSAHEVPGSADRYPPRGPTTRLGWCKDRERTQF